MSAVVESLVGRYDTIKPHLSERQRRLWLGVEARELGKSGVRIVAQAVQVSPNTVRRGREELDDPRPLEVDRSRAPGGEGASAPRNTTPAWSRRWTDWWTPNRGVIR